MARRTPWPPSALRPSSTWCVEMLGRPFLTAALRGEMGYCGLRGPKAGRLGPSLRAARGRRAERAVLVLEQVAPLTGPVDGGTRVTVRGSNLGRHVQDVQDTVRVAGVPCVVDAQEYEVSSR